MRTKIKAFLRENKLSPVSKENWCFFEIVHKEPLRRDKIGTKKKIREFIRAKVGDSKGVYIYKKGDKFLYVGKGKPLKNRLYSHYSESFEKVSGDTKDNKYHRFFKKHEGKLEVYWKDLPEEGVRRIVEEMFNYVLKPKFNGFR
ncbi:MAG: hypothetical protein Q8N67_05600 [Candidatus Omnitrophota bacterium]|nr:hypothetical protein [Candidatus Omnitrophota bacterium]